MTSFGRNGLSGVISSRGGFFNCVKLYFLVLLDPRREGPMISGMSEFFFEFEHEGRGCLEGKPLFALFGGLN